MSALMKLGKETRHAVSSRNIMQPKCKRKKLQNSKKKMLVKIETNPGGDSFQKPQQLSQIVISPNTNNLGTARRYSYADNNGMIPTNLEHNSSSLSFNSSEKVQDSIPYRTNNKKENYFIFNKMPRTSMKKEKSLSCPSINNTMETPSHSHPNKIFYLATHAKSKINAFRRYSMMSIRKDTDPNISSR